MKLDRNSITQHSVQLSSAARIIRRTALAATLVGLALPALAGKDVWTATTPPAGGAYYAMTSDNRGNAYAADYSYIFSSTANTTTWNTHFESAFASVNTLVTDAAGNLYAAANTAGLYKSTDGGQTWSGCWTGYSVSGVTIDTAGNVYIATPLGILKSSNGGATWISVTKGVSSQYYANPSLSQLTADGRGNVYVLAMNVGVFKTSNGGASWTLLGDAGDTLGILKADAFGNLYEGTQNGVFRYVSGTTWSQVLPTYSLYPNGALATDPSGKVYAATTGGVFESANQGASWTTLASTLKPNGLTTGMGWFYSMTVGSSGTIYVGENSTIYEYTP